MELVAPGIGRPARGWLLSLPAAVVALAPSVPGTATVPVSVTIVAGSGQAALPGGARDRMQMVLEAVGPVSGRVAGILTQIDSATGAMLVTPLAPPGPQTPGIGVGR